MQDTVNQGHGAVPRALADIAGVIVCGSLRGKAIAPLSEYRRHSAYRMGGSCPAMAPSCPPSPRQPMPGHGPPNVWPLGLTMSHRERCRGFTHCDQNSAEEARSPAFRSARPLSHGECARCACRSGRSARMRASALSGPGPRLALAPPVPLDTRHHQRHEHDDDQDPGLRPSGDPGIASRRRRLIPAACSPPHTGRKKLAIYF
jgi:hypothetical protein